MKEILYFITGLVSGVLQGMGMGGGTVLIPALSLLFEIPQHQSQAINMISFIPCALAAIYVHNKEGRIDKAAAKGVIIIGAVAAIAGAFGASLIEAEWLKKIFGGFLVVLAVTQWGKGKDEQKPKGEVGGESSDKKMS